MAKVGTYGNYGQLELNQVAFPRDGRIEAQLPLDPTVFGKDVGANHDDIPCQVGMILVVDKAGDPTNNKKPCVTVAGAKGGDDGEIFALNYSTEHMYDERTPGLRYFCQYPADEAASVAYDMTRYDDFYPRLGYLAVGDRFTTNTVNVDLENAYGGLTVGATLTADVDGYWTAGTGTTAPTVKVTELTTMPDGHKAVKVIVVKA